MSASARHRRCTTPKLPVFFFTIITTITIFEFCSSLMGLISIKHCFTTYNFLTSSGMFFCAELASLETCHDLHRMGGLMEKEED